ncbi:hypothetical protein VP1G_08237 [Cytospora mali]|uniref:Uncharacterized protein n=1 Tax=Cytospora mali TaxID=578113 RepID=A0A194VAI8_CYTMA|nr:hypothetical protein VP1G_08237 [Valsa mali var. pyri (nom. inval.)]
MKSSMVAALGGLAVLSQAQQPVSRASSKSHTVATVAVVDVKANTKPIVIPVPTTVVFHDGTMVTEEMLGTVTTTKSKHNGSPRPSGYNEHDKYSEPPRNPHGSVQPYDPGEDMPERPDLIIDPENACPRGYSCQPDHESDHEHHGSVHRIGDDCGNHCKRGDGKCQENCEADRWSPPSGCEKHCGDGKCWDECIARPFLPRPQPIPVCPRGFSCQKKKKPRESESSSPCPSSSLSDFSVSSTPDVSTTIVPTPIIVTSVIPVPIATLSVVPAPVPPPPFMPTSISPAPTDAASTSANPAPTGAVPLPPVSQPDRPHHTCPVGEHPCPYRHRNGTTAPPAIVTTAEAGYVQPVVGLAMIIAAVFGLLMV